MKIEELISEAASLGFYYTCNKGFKRAPDQYQAIFYNIDNVKVIGHGGDKAEATVSAFVQLKGKLNT